MEYQFEIIVCAINAMLIPGLFWVGLEKILHEEEWNKFIISITIIFAVCGIILFLFSKLDRLQMAFSISFIFPIYHLCFYRGLRRIFMKRKKREPIDVAFNFKSGLMADRAFAIFFVLFSIFSSLMIIGFNMELFK